MKKMIGFFNSMYSDAAAASFLLDFTGRIVWHNNSAEEYLAYIESSVDEIISEIITSEAASGSLLCIDDAAYRKINDDDAVYYFIEISDKKSIINLYENSYIARHIQEFDMILRQEITGISASCEAVKGCLDGTEPVGIEEAGGYLNNVMNACVRLMKISSLGSVLSAISSDASLDDMVIECESFIEEIQRGCDKMLRIDTTFKPSQTQNGYISADRLLLTSFMLILIRRLLSALNDYKGTLEFSSKVSADKVCFIVKALQCSSADEADGPENEIDDFFITAAAKMLNAEYELSPGRLKVVFPASEQVESVELNDEMISLDDGFFSLYNIILDEWSELNSPF